MVQWSLRRDGVERARSRTAARAHTCARCRCGAIIPRWQTRSAWAARRSCAASVGRAQRRASRSTSTPRELTARGAFRARAPLASLRDVARRRRHAPFRAGGDDVALVLGRAAPRWAAALAKPPPALAAKLGITAATRVLASQARSTTTRSPARWRRGDRHRANAELIVARVDDADALARIASEHARAARARVPLWVVYTKGKGAPLGETAVRAMLRERGLSIVKVAAVSATLTALQFARRAVRPNRRIAEDAGRRFGNAGAGGTAARRGSALDPRDRARASRARRSRSCWRRTAATPSASRSRATAARGAAKGSPTCSCRARTPPAPRSRR